MTPDFLCHSVRLRIGIGGIRAMALRLRSRSIAAYLLVVSKLACPNHWLIVERSTPALRRAIAVLCRRQWGCRRLRAIPGAQSLARSKYFVNRYRTPKRVSG